MLDELTFVICPSCGKKWTRLTSEGVCPECLDKRRLQKLEKLPQNILKQMLLDNQIWGNYFREYQKKGKLDRFVFWVLKNFPDIVYLKNEFSKMEGWIITAGQRGNKKCWDKFIRNWLSKYLKGVDNNDGQFTAIRKEETT